MRGPVLSALLWACLLSATMTIVSGQALSTTLRTGTTRPPVPATTQRPSSSPTQRPYTTWRPFPYTTRRPYTTWRPNPYTTWRHYTTWRPYPSPTRRPYTTQRPYTTWRPYPYTTRRPYTTWRPYPYTTWRPNTTQRPTPKTNRTVILLEKRTDVYQYLFFKGSSHDCNYDCDIPIRHLPIYEMRTKVHSREEWAKGDRYLDWNGAEAGQGTWNAQEAKGSPGIWTTNDTHHLLYHPLNKYGDNYWLLDVEMDCSYTNNDLFEFKAYVSNTQIPWEKDIPSNSCIGPYALSQGNHIGVCGFINVFHWESSQCTLETFEPKIDFSDYGVGK